MKCMETCFYSPPSLPDAQSIFFLNAFVPLLSCLVYLGRFPFLRSSVIPNSLHNLCLHGIRPAEIFCGGKVVAGLCPLFVRALFLASSPRNPRTLARARLDFTVQCLIGKFISSPREQKYRNTSAQALAAP